MKRFLLLVLALMLCCLVGCDYSKYGKEYVGGTNKPEMKIYGDELETGFLYAVDSNTNVVYITYEGHSWYGITPCLKPDGTPMLADDLGLK